YAAVAHDELLRHLGDVVAVDGEADARRLRAPEVRVQGGERRDADDGAVEIDERPAGVARVDGGARLDRRLERDAVALGDLAADGGDDALGDARGEAERIADRDREVADADAG